MIEDPYNLNRFVAAQSGAFNGTTFDQAYRELTNGKKIGHWMWFIFPQVLGLGSTEVSNKFAIRSMAEANAYMKHALLGSRLIEISQIVNSIQNKSVREVFGNPDDLKLASCMTLFSRTDKASQIFASVVNNHLEGKFDLITLKLIGP